MSNLFSWQRSVRLRAALATVFAMALSTATAGGISIQEDSVEFEGPRQVSPGSQVVIRFRASQYTYGSNQFGYTAIAVAPSSDSRRVNSANFDRWDVYGLLLTTPSGERLFEDEARPFVVRFPAPERPGKYDVIIGGVPIFRNAPLKTGGGRRDAFVPHTNDKRELSRTIAGYPGMVRYLASFEVLPAGRTIVDESPPLYLRLNNKIPTDVTVTGGVHDEALRFSWSVGPEFRGERRGLLYRYRLDPADDEWSAWTSATSVDYAFLARGVHQFSVQARSLRGESIVDSRPATYQFSIGKEYVSRPTKASLTKAPFGATPSTAQSVSFANVYSKSRALLVGLWNFSDTNNLPQFDKSKIQADIDGMRSALLQNGFESVQTLMEETVKREDIAKAIETLLGSVNRDDRVLVYFSTHGFPDPTLPTDAYLATTDCEVSSPGVRCFRLNDLDTVAQRMIEGKQARQVLFVIDSCFSGLGVSRKSTAYTPDLARLAARQGAFMLTAGMANQTAQIDPTLGKSTFTHYLVEGLKGKADIMGNDGIITLAELYVYVQYEVARQTRGEQIPMLGKIRGDGEMLFRPTR